MTREICKRCWRESCLGYDVPDDVWEAAVKGRYNVLCILCFDDLATEAGVDWTASEAAIKFWPVSGMMAART